MRKSLILLALTGIIIFFTNFVFAQPTINLKATVNGAPAGDTSATTIYFASDGTNGYNGNDVVELFASDPNFCNIYAYISGAGVHSDLSIADFPPLTANRYVNLGFNVNATGNFTITASDSNFANGTQIILIDSTQHKKQDLMKNKSYSFTFNTSENVPNAGSPDGNSRFYLHFILSSPSGFPINTEGLSGSFLVLGVNPVKQTAIIKYQSSINSNVLLKIYDVTGKEEATLVNEIKEQGEHELKYNINNLKNGIYYLSLIIGENHITKKLVVIK